MTVHTAVSLLQATLEKGTAPGQSSLTAFVMDPARMEMLRDELAMYFYTSNTPPERVTNHHLQR
jgi:hypothetical protein